MGRRNILAIVAVVAVLSAGLGWVLGQRIKSPAELAAETAPPDPSLITVPVELRELSSRVVVRGTVESSGSTSVSVSGSVEGVALITRLPLESGDSLEEGDVVIEVAGRPVIVLQGELPEFRNLAPGMDGPDIEQLEAALNRLGYEVGDVDDLYTVSTGLAVAELYEDLGYRADAPSRDELAVLDAAEDRVDQILDQLNAASGSGSSSALPRSQLLQLDQSITQATEAVADAKMARETGVADLAAARSEALAAKADAHQAVADAEARLGQAQSGTHPDTGQPPTAAELDALAEAVTEAKMVAVEAATAASDATLAYDRAAVAFDRAIRDANVQLEIAKASKSEAIAAAAQGDDGGIGVNVADLREDLAEAREDLVALQATIGVRLPAAEFRFVKTLPSVVQSVDVELGQVPIGPVLSIAGASTVLESSVSESDRRLLDVGMEGVAEDDDIGVTVPVRIAQLADQPRSGDSGGVGRYPMELVPLGPVPEEAMFQSLRVTIPVSSTGGEVLAVPLAAVSAGADGSSRVEVENDDGSTTLIEVSTGLSAEGFVEVRPVEGELRPGDRVVVGRDLLLPSDGAGGSDGDNGDDGGDSESESESEDGEAVGSGVRS